MTLQEIFSGIDHVRIAIIGDFCLDAYWLADMKKSELSRETPHYFMPVVQERYSAGGAGNVACNIAALRPQGIQAIGVIGSDWRGVYLKKLLEDCAIDAERLVADPSRVTSAYIKPQRMGISDTIYEDPRLDFDNYRRLCDATENRLLNALDQLDADLLCVCDQMRFGCITDRVREKLSQMGKGGMKILVDSRDHVGEYRNVIVKPNEVEAARALGSDENDPVIAARLSESTGRPVIVTLGGKGCLVCENQRTEAVPAVPTKPPIDICGAGDTFLAGLACAYAGGASLIEAARFATVAASITIQKLNTTGTASRQELEAAWSL